MTPTSNFTSFAVAGGLAGSGASLGALIAKKLLAEGAKVTVLTRGGQSATSPAAADLESRGATLNVVDYASEDSLVAALSGIEVVVSALNMGGLASQPALAKAAAKAGVKLFVPSEFGNPTHDLSPTAPVYSRTALQHSLKDELHLPFTVFYNGVLAEFSWFVIGLQEKDGGRVIEIAGDGEREVCWVGMEYQAGYVAKVLTTTPPAKLFNTRFTIPAKLRSFLSLAKIYQTALPALDIQIKHLATTADEAAAKGDLVTYLRAALDEGQGIQKEDWSEDVLGGREGMVDAADVIRMDAEKRAKA